MSTFAARAYHPSNGAVEEIWEGFSWPCLFLGFIWYIYKGMWGWGVIALILAFVTMGLSWLVFPFFANAQHAESLLKRGYLNKKQWNEKNSGSHSNAPHAVHPISSIADELAKLVALREQGILNDEEYLIQKNKLLS